MNFLLRRLDELEKENYILDCTIDQCNGRIEELEAENARLREALAFYAELDGNGIQLYGEIDSKALEIIDRDSQPFGTVAREALKGNEE